jgi:hypothetical protein
VGGAFAVHPRGKKEPRIGGERQRRRVVEIGGRQADVGERASVERSEAPQRRARLGDAERPQREGNDSGDQAGRGAHGIGSFRLFESRNPAGAARDNWVQFG